MPSVETISGSGSFDGDTLVSFSYSEDATPLGPENLDGGTGQVTAQLVARVVRNGRRKVSINNTAVLTDEDYGSITFDVKKLSFNEGLVSVIGNTIQSKLDVDRTAQPQGSDASGYNLYEAILHYCQLVDVVPSFESGLQAKLEAIDVDFIGWQGNVWEHLKMLCAAQPIDPDDNTLLEMYIKDDELWFREGLKNNIDTSDIISNESVEIDVFDAAQEVSIFKYNTDYRANSLIRQQNIDTLQYANLENVSIVDSFQVDANEKITRRILVNASLESIEQPIAVGTIAFPVTYSQYVIVGNDNLPITPAQWNAMGGSVSVSITENPNEIEVTIIGANDKELAPFSVGVESAGGDDYPAFYLIGTGVFFEKEEFTVYTGAPSAEEISATTIDNPFITSDRTLWDRGMAAARSLCGPSIVLNQDIPVGLQFGEAVGSIVDSFDSKFRVSSTVFNQNGVSISGEAYVKFSDFNQTWAGATIEDFNTTFANMNFNEFSVVPISRSE